MPKDKAQELEQAKNTGILFAALNVAALPFYLLGSRIGLAASIAVNSAALYLMNEHGKSLRRVDNTVHRVGNFFAPSVADQISNSFDNVIASGDNVYKQLTQK